jgi:hypothetical protein
MYKNIESASVPWCMPSARLIDERYLVWSSGWGVHEEAGKAEYLPAECSVVFPLLGPPPVWQFFLFSQIQLLCLRGGRVSTLRGCGNAEALTGAAKEEAARAVRMTAAKERKRIVGFASKTRGISWMGQAYLRTLLSSCRGA